MTEWIGRVDYEATVDDADIERLADHFDNATFTPGKVTLLLHADAPTLRQAAEDVLRTGRDAMHGAGLPVRPAAMQVQTLAEFDAGVYAPLLPNLVGYVEIGEILGVSRQRARVVAEFPDFPPPVIDRAEVKLYLREQVEAFNLRWDRRPGPKGGRATGPTPAG